MRNALFLFVLSYQVLSLGNILDKAIRETDSVYRTHCIHPGATMGICGDFAKVDFIIEEHSLTSKISESLVASGSQQLICSNGYCRVKIDTLVWYKAKTALTKIKNENATYYSRIEGNLSTFGRDNTWSESCRKVKLQSNREYTASYQRGYRYPVIRSDKFYGWGGRPDAAECGIFISGNKDERVVDFSQWDFFRHIGSASDRVNVEFKNKNKSNTAKLVLWCGPGSHNYPMSPITVTDALKNVGIDLTCQN